MLETHKTVGQLQFLTRQVPSVQANLNLRLCWYIWIQSEIYWPNLRSAIPFTSVNRQGGNQDSSVMYLAAFNVSRIQVQTKIESRTIASLSTVFVFACFSHCAQEEFWHLSAADTDFFSDEKRKKKKQTKRRPRRNVPTEWVVGICNGRSRIFREAKMFSFSQK